MLKLYSLLMRLAEDQEYKKRFKTDPQKYLKEVCGIVYSEKVKIIIFENSEEKIYLVLPLLEKAMERYQEAKESDPEHSLYYQKISDPAIRERLIQAPKETLENEFHITFPEKCQVELLEEREGEKYLVIPALSQIGEMSDQQLAEISGGAGLYASSQLMTLFTNIFSLEEKAPAKQVYVVGPPNLNTLGITIRTPPRVH